eukprot:TRINITY_DN9217_c0_g1_i1.p1 TRINITY_DN9217_c0_g1~~TRINITY_DN9217_c0_g1_i1.p1  ORF type:complete len:1509 (+),score=426.29 TRINITY_DN9217_c0_g1_i1:53-4579(+)
MRRQEDPVLQHLRRVLHSSGDHDARDQYCRLLRIAWNRASSRKNLRLTVVAWRPGRAPLRPVSPEDSDAVAATVAARSGKPDVSVLAISGAGNLSGWTEALRAAASDDEYTLLLEATRGGCVLCLWVRNEHLGLVESVHVSTFLLEGRGCAAARVVIGGKRLCVLNCALPPRTRRWRRRATCAQAALAACYESLGRPPTEAGKDGTVVGPARADDEKPPATHYDAGEFTAHSADAESSAALLASHDYCVVTGALESRSPQEGRDQLSEALRHGACFPGFLDADTRGVCETSYFPADAAAADRPDRRLRVPGRTARVLLFSHEYRGCRAKLAQVVPLPDLRSRPLTVACDVSVSTVEENTLREVAAEVVREVEPDSYFAFSDIREYLRHFYSQHNQEKVLDVDRVVSDSAAQGADPHELIRAVHRRYSVTPQGWTAAEAIARMPKAETDLRWSLEKERGEACRHLETMAKALRSATLCERTGTAEDEDGSVSSGDEAACPHQVSAGGSPLAADQAMLPPQEGMDKLAAVRAEEERRQRLRQEEEARLRSSVADVSPGDADPDFRGAFRPGDRVDGLWQGQDDWQHGWYPGTVEAVHPDGRCDVLWDGGTASRLAEGCAFAVAKLRPSVEPVPVHPPPATEVHPPAAAPPADAAPPAAPLVAAPAAPAPTLEAAPAASEEAGRLSSLSPGAQSLADKLLSAAVLACGTGADLEDEMSAYYPPSSIESGQIAAAPPLYVQASELVDLTPLREAHKRSVEPTPPGAVRAARPRQRTSNGPIGGGERPWTYLPSYTLGGGMSLLWSLARERYGDASVIDYVALCSLACEEYWTMLHERGRAMQRIRENVRTREQALKLAAELKAMQRGPKISKLATEMRKMSPRMDQGRDFYDYTLCWLQRAVRKRGDAIKELEAEARKELDKRPEMSKRSRQIVAEMMVRGDDAATASTYDSAVGQVYRHPVKEWQVHALEHALKRRRSPPPCASFEPVINDRSYELAEHRQWQSITERLEEDGQRQMARRQKLHDDRQAELSKYDRQNGQKLFTPNATPTQMVVRDGKAKRVKFWEAPGPDGKPQRGADVRWYQKQEAKERRPPDEVVGSLLGASKKSREKFQRKIKKEEEEFLRKNFKPALSERTEMIHSLKPRTPVHLRKNPTGDKKLRVLEPGQRRQVEPKFGIGSHPSVVERRVEEANPYFSGKRVTEEDQAEYFASLFKRLKDDKQKHENKMKKAREKKATEEIKECKFSPGLEEQSKRIFRRSAPRAHSPDRADGKVLPSYEDASVLLTGASPASSRSRQRTRRRGDGSASPAPAASWCTASQPPPLSVSRSPVQSPREDRLPTTGELRRPRWGAPASPSLGWAQCRSGWWQTSQPSEGGSVVEWDRGSEEAVQQYYKPLTPSQPSDTPGHEPPQYGPRDGGASQRLQGRAPPSPAPHPSSLSPQPLPPPIGATQQNMSPPRNLHHASVQPQPTSPARGSPHAVDPYDVIEQHISTMYGVLHEYKDLEHYASSLA